MDSVIGKARGKKQSLLVLTERRTRFEIIFRVSAKTSAATVSALSRIVPRFPEGTFKTLTVDNGSEFQDADGIQALVPGLYYCHPYTSCERGSNENANRIIRRFLPKGKSMRNIRQKDCDDIASRMNGMWRFKLILKKNGLPEKLNVHSLRHSNASLLIANGADVATVAGLRGHSQPSTTLDIYTHAFDKNKKAASEALQRGLDI